MSDDSRSSGSQDEIEESSPYGGVAPAVPTKRCEDDPLNLLQGISSMFVNYAKN